MPNKNKPTFTVDEIVTFLKNEAENETIEGQLIRRKLIRELYKQLGSPTEEDFGKEMEPAGTYWEKFAGYTTNIEVMSETKMKEHNNEPTYWQISYPSATKKAIVRRYKEKGWHCNVGPYVVSCYKFVKHPKYENLWVMFRSTRDNNKYEYIIED